MTAPHPPRVDAEADATELRLGFSPCPNDTFIFHALAHDLIAPEIRWRVTIDDVEALNRMALHDALDVVKISYHAFLHVADRYRMLSAGGALGRGVGPLVVTRDDVDDLDGATIATPGGLTTAHLLLQLWRPHDADVTTMRYDRIMPAVASGAVDAGLIIHESRFTYPEHGLRAYDDLGAWWERTTGRPIPLGGIAIRRSLGPATARRVDAAIRASLEHAWRHPDASAAYVALHAQEMAADVRQRHIDLYVNEFSRDLGREGREAVAELRRRAVARGLVSAHAAEPFLESA